MLKCKINGLKIWVRLKLKIQRILELPKHFSSGGPRQLDQSSTEDLGPDSVDKLIWWGLYDSAGDQRDGKWIMSYQYSKNPEISCFWRSDFQDDETTCREEFFLLTNLLLAYHLCILSPFLKFFCQNLLNVQEFNVLSIGIILNIFTYNIYCTPINHLKPLSRGMNIYLMFLVVCPKTGTWVTGYWWRSSHTYTHPRTLRPLLVSVYHRSHARRPVRCYEILKNAYASI